MGNPSYTKIHLIVKLNNILGIVFKIIFSRSLHYNFHTICCAIKSSDTNGLVQKHKNKIIQMQKYMKFLFDLTFHNFKKNIFDFLWRFMYIVKFLGIFSIF